jgi:nucleoside-diphosphate-sugar epimerase
VAERVLVTGALGCVGAWVVRQLTAEGAAVVALDNGGSDARLRLLLDDDALAAIDRVDCDITDGPALSDVVRGRDVSHVIHLAALQVPFCRATPSLGAAVNVVGTVNVFEAVKAAGGIAGPIVYASSVAAYGAPDGDDTVGEATPTGEASTLYGVYKRANEGTARVYAADDGIPSIGLRPYVVYGVGRDQGMTSSPTFAMLAAAARQPYEITYSGTSHLQLARDVAAAFVAAARSSFRDAAVFNLGGSVIDMGQVVEAIAAAAPESAGRITVGGPALPFPPEVDHSGLEAAIGPVPETPLDEGVASTIETFRDLIARGAIDPPG